MNRHSVHLQWLLLLGIVVLGTSCRTTAKRHVSDPRPAIARLHAGGSIQAEVDDVVKPLADKGEVYGLAVGVLTPDGRTQAFGYGRTGCVGDLESPGTNSLFQVGSVSKVFVAALLARLVQEGQLRYEDTVSSILPADIPVSPEVGRLTLYELVTHTGGLSREPATLSQLRSLLEYLVTGHNLYAHLTKPYLYAYLRHCRLKPRERRQFLYSNIGIGLLAHLIEVKIGRPVTDLVVEKICRPLNMRDSVFVLNQEQQKRLTVGHTGNQGCFKARNSPMAPWDMGEIMRPSAGMYSSLNDLLIFARANLSSSHHPLEPALASTHHLQVENLEDGIALGWIINRFDEGRRTITFKHGMVSGYCAYIGLDLDTQVAVVFLSNKFDWDEKIGHNLLLRLAGAYQSEQPETYRISRR